MTMDGRYVSDLIAANRVFAPELAFPNDQSSLDLHRAL
jgi:hypothetical protein